MGKSPKQQTPQGATIPIPTRKQVLDDLRKVASAPKPASDADGGGAEDEE